MAITKIWNIAKSKDGNLSNSLHRSLLYIVNPVKTDGGVLVGGINVMPDAELAYEQMCETKQTFGKELGRQGYHVVLSCPVGEGDPQTMYQLTQEFIEEYMGDRYEALFAVHVDKGHLHSHQGAELKAAPGDQGAGRVQSVLRDGTGLPVCGQGK